VTTSEDRARGKNDQCVFLVIEARYLGDVDDGKMKLIVRRQPCGRKDTVANYAIYSDS